MKNLIKSEFYRILKDKMTIIFGAIYFGISIFIVFMFLFLGALIGEDIFTDSGVFVYNMSLSITGNAIFLLIVGVGLLLVKDYTSGVIKNKIIMGYSRPKIFFASFIAMFSLYISLVIVTILAVFGLSSALFGMGDVFTFTTFIQTFLIALLHFAFMYCLMSLFANLFKNNAMPIVLTIGLTMLFTFGGTIIQAVLGSGINEVVAFIFKIIPFIQNIMISMGSLISLGETTILSTSDVLIFVISTVIWIAGLIGLSFLAVNKTDLK